MTPADIIRMAREAGFGPAVEWPECYPPFERFAVIVAAAKQLEIEGLRIRLLAAERGEQEAARAEDLHRQAEALLTGDERQAVANAVAVEREACAKVCNDLYPHSGYHPTLRKAAGNCAAAIRARNQQTGAPS